MTENLPVTPDNIASTYNPVAKTKTPRLPLILGLILLAFVLDVLLFYTFVTNKRVSEGDFYIPWKASQEMLFNGRNPYSDEVTALIQVGMTGQVFDKDVPDRLSFNYPLYDALLLAPFTPLPYPLAEAIWNVTNQFALILLVWQLTRLVGWQPRGVIRTGLYLWAFLFYSCIFTIGWGQYTILTLLAIVLGARLLQSGRYNWAGLMLALALFKPQTAGVLVGLLLLWCLFHFSTRWRALLSFGLSFGLMLVEPMLWQADWLKQWLDSSAYRRLHPGMYSGAEEVVHYNLGVSWDNVFGPGLVLAGILSIALIWLWWRLGPDLYNRLFPQLLALGGLVTLIALPQFGGANDMVLYPALFWGGAWLALHFKGRVLLLAFVATIVLPYLLIFGIGFMSWWIPLRAIIILVAYIWTIWLVRQQLQARPQLQMESLN